ncbi:cytochrome c maturation protein CcmE [Gammaproteobacteria bacterium LSUCC0057]|uniref:Cytochrome c-type biogenesis protein CcmE n=1 Tax=Gammaproteobacteria bacterium LSUCC0057 TaxID=2559237 RepID=A0A4Y8UKI5_9GAMM|nr:cytochrome c maturation protein CcmE [Gammaproteobacteria bacterium LSUCC0057]
MHPLRKQRLKWVLLIVVASSIAVGLFTFALRENINLFYTPIQIVDGEAPTDVRLRAGGMVVKGSIERADDSLFVAFRVTDGAESVRIEYTGILPDLFAEGEAIVATGVLDQNRVLQASEVLAKHDETYMPPEVAEAMEQGHQRREAQKGSGAESPSGYSKGYPSEEKNYDR